MKNILRGSKIYILIVAAGMALAYFLETDYAEKGVFMYHDLIHFPQEKNVADHRRMCIIHLGDTGAVRFYPDCVL